MSTDPVSITNIKLEEFADHQLLSADVDGENIWYRLPVELTLTPRPEAFLAPALFEAMVRGVPVEVEDGMPVSRKLLQSINEAQTIFNCWNKELNIVPVHAQSAANPPAGDIVACCFSGGIDSSYTYAHHREEITHLLLVEGFAAGRGGPNDWAENIEARRKFAEAEGKSLVAVHSNVTKFLGSRDISILLTHGALLGCLAAGLGFKQLLVPASYTFSELMPWGSHPLLDPLWSTESSRIVHHGANAARIEKTAYVSKHQYLLDQLQVCWFAGGRNCGTCGKCIRTSLALYLLGAHSKSLTPYSELKQLKVLKDVNAQGYPFLGELAKMAADADEKAIARRLRGYLRRYRINQAVTGILREMAGTRGRNLVRRIRPHAWHSARGSLHAVKTTTPSH